MHIYSCIMINQVCIYCMVSLRTHVCYKELILNYFALVWLYIYKYTHYIIAFIPHPHHKCKDAASLHMVLILSLSFLCHPCWTLHTENNSLLFFGMKGKSLHFLNLLIGVMVWKWWQQYLLSCWTQLCLCFCSTCLPFPPQLNTNTTVSLFLSCQCLKYTFSCPCLLFCSCFPFTMFVFFSFFACLWICKPIQMP